MSIDFFQDYLRRENLRNLIKPFETGEMARTAEGAAEVIGCDLNQIVKSLIVESEGRFYAFLVPGSKQLDLGQAANVLRTHEARMAKHDEIKKATGFEVGGVPPFGHKEKLRTFILTGFPKDKPLYASAGEIDKTFEINYDDLFQITNAQEYEL